MLDLVGERNLAVVGRLKKIMESKEANPRAKGYESSEIHHELLKEKNKLLNLQKIRFSDTVEGTME